VTITTAVTSHDVSRHDRGVLHAVDVEIEIRINGLLLVRYVLVHVLCEGYVQPRAVLTEQIKDVPDLDPWQRADVISAVTCEALRAARAKGNATTERSAA